MAKTGSTRSKQYIRERIQLQNIYSRHFATNQTGNELRGLVGSFIDLITQKTNSVYIKRCQRATQQAADDFRGLLYAMHIFDGCSSESDKDLASLKARAQVQLFFSDFRSIFDYMLAATLILFRREIAAQLPGFPTKLRDQIKGQIKRPNFPSFINAIKKYRKEANGLFGQNLVRLWLGCSWFAKFNDYRNDIVHGGFFVSVYKLDMRYFRLETLTGGYPIRRSQLPPKMFGPERSVSFGCFSGFYGALLFHFLNDWARLMQVQANLRKTNKGYIGVGGTVFYRNVQEALKALP
jgi:hypothetical protein